jgi:AraC family transcriptional regulator, regulatory protein of adaptative response / methylphosphotriester-DNA alkyltransferase methyltransferase
VEDRVRQATHQRRRAVYEEAVQVIESKYATDLDLDQLAREIATSRRQLQRVFAEVGDTSFREYLAKVRMRHAARLLREGAIPVREVAQSVGYRQPAQFAKAFRRHHDVSPSTYRSRSRFDGAGPALDATARAA